MKLWSELEITTGNFADFSDLQDVYNAIMAGFCVVCAGLAAGLTMGLLSFDVTKLEIKTMTGTNEEKSAAAAILPIVKQHHLLLVTLLLFNSIANETLPIFLGALVPNYLAVIISVFLILIFGEILPSALFTGPNQLLTAARLTKLVYFLFIIFYPISFPLSKLLDFWFGVDESGGNISRNELEALVILQGSNHRRLARENSIMSEPSSQSQSGSAKEDSESEADGLSAHEVNMMTGILRLSKQTVKNAMIPAKKVFMISSSTRLNEKSLYDILDCGFSRIIVFKRHDRQHILGYLLVKTLIVVNPLDEKMVEDLSLREPLFVRPTVTLMEMLTIFQEGHCHMAIVTNDPEGSLASLRDGTRPVGDRAMLGIVTLEDVLEKIIQSDIVDETDAVIYPSVFPNGGAPTVFYHHVIRPSQYGKIGGSTSPKRKGTGGGMDAKHKKYRNLLISQSSVVKSEHYSAVRRDYATFAPKEHNVKVVKNYDEISPRDDSPSDDSPRNDSPKEDEDLEKGETSPLII